MFVDGKKNAKATGETFRDIEADSKTRLKISRSTGKTSTKTQKIEGVRIDETFIAGSGPGRLSLVLFPRNRPLPRVFGEKSTGSKGREGNKGLNVQHRHPQLFQDSRILAQKKRLFADEGTNGREVSLPQEECATQEVNCARQARNISQDLRRLILRHFRDELLYSETRGIQMRLEVSRRLLLRGKTPSTHHWCEESLINAEGVGIFKTVDELNVTRREVETFWLTGGGQ